MIGRRCRINELMELKLTILKDQEYQYVSDVFKYVKNEVKISFFTQESKKQSGREARQILEKLSSISDKIVLNIFDFDKNKKEVTDYRIDKVPATVVEGTKDFGIRYFGVPAGYLVSSLIEDIVQISKNESELKYTSIRKLEVVKKPLNLQVFVSATSPYSPSLVNISHRMAIEIDQITAHMIDVKEFPHLALKYNIIDEPFTIVNDKIPVEGALNEDDFVDIVINAYHKTVNKS